MGRNSLDNVFHLNHDINRALYHEGKLLEEMFRYPQAVGALFLFNRKGREKGISRLESERVAGLLFELGRVNAAERMTHEMLQRFGDYGATLRLLAEINIVKEQTPAALVFLGYLDDLRNDPLLERWAEQMLSRFEATDVLPVDERLRQIRSWNVQQDSFGHLRTIPGDMEELLKSNPKNRMAFEYLIANFLLINRPQDVVDNIERFRDLGYERLPRHVQEATLLCGPAALKKVELHGYQIEAKIRRQFSTIMRAAKHFGKDPGSRQRFLAYLAGEEYRKTYFFHFFYASPSSAGAKKQ